MILQHNKPVVGLALGSGSARGWAHIGIIQSLEEMGLVPEIICGCSIGALVGASHAAGNLQKLEEWVCSLSTRKLASFFELNLSLKGFVDARRLHQFLVDHVCAEDTHIEDLDKTFAAVATELESGRELWFTEGPVLDAVWSSMSMPGLFPPIRNKGKWLVDGAMVNPVPVSICRALGADIVIAVNLNGDLVGKHFNLNTQPVAANKDNLLNSLTSTFKSYSESFFGNTKTDDQPPGLFEAIAGSINIVEDRLTRSRMAGDPPDILLTPRLSHIDPLEFQRAREAIEEGQKTVSRMSSEINYLVEKIHHNSRP